VTKTLLLVALVMVVVATLSLFVRNKPGTTQQPSGKGYEAYLGLRNLILTGSRTKFSLPVTSQPTEPWGVVMDWKIKNGTVTVVAMSDGNASIYLSSGGGSLGGVGQEPIQNAAKKAVSLASAVQPQMKATRTFPLPGTGEVEFYALTDAGVFTANVPEADLRAGRGPFSNLGNAMQEIIAAYRIHEQNYQKPPS
jgi:hypothetical protein